MFKTEVVKIDEFVLGPGEIYIRPGKVPQDEMEKYMYKAGDLMGGCSLKYEYSIRELYDVNGDIAGTLRYGEKLKLKGKLCCILGKAFDSLVKGGAAHLSVLVVSPVAGGEALRIFMEGAVVTALDMGMSDLSEISFEIRCGRGETKPVFEIGGAL